MHNVLEEPATARPPLKPSSLLGLVGFLIPPFAVAALGSIWTRSNVDSDWFRALEKPSWNPPNWVFGPVWSFLYLVMAIAAWRVWLSSRQAEDEALPLGLWTGQLALNLAWPFAFFQLHSPIAGLIVIVPLWLTIVATIVAFAPRSRVAALLLSPYIAWVTFATALNLAIVLKN